MIWISSSKVFLKQVKGITWRVQRNKKYNHTLSLEKLKSAEEASYLAPMELAAWKS